MRRAWVQVGRLLAVLTAAIVAARGVDLPDVTAVRRWVSGAGVPGLLPFSWSAIFSQRARQDSQIPESRAT